MKTFVKALCFSLLLCLGFARQGNTQGCRLDYTPNYSIYNTESSDGTHIYTTVVLDGSTTGNGSAGCNYPNATHTPTVSSTLNGTTVSATGTPQYMNSYSSVSRENDIVGQPGILYPFEGSGEIICSVFGTFWSGGFSIKLAIAVSSYKYQSYAGGDCTYALACPNGNQNASCGSPTTEVFVGTEGPSACGPYLVDDDIRLIINGKTTCAPIGPGSMELSPATCQ